MIVDHGTITEEEVYKLAGERSQNCIKVNIRYEEGMNGEGIWAVCCTPEDRALWADDKSHGKSFFVYIMNDPICPDIKFRSKVECLTNGGQRPYSKEISGKDGKDAYDGVRGHLAGHGQQS